jgi:beta-lactamase class A
MLPSQVRLACSPLVLVWVTALLAGCAQAPAPASPDTDPLAERLVARARDAGAEIAVAVRTLDRHTALLVNADEVFHAASTMKVPVMVELFRQADQGRLSLDDELTVVETFRSIVDGSAYRLSAADDSDKALYEALGSTRSLRDLCESMIVVSSNLATNLLIDHLGVENVRATVDRLGASGMNVRRGVEDGKAFQAGLNNTTTARGLLELLAAIADGRASSPRATEEMLGILKRQQFKEGIPAGVPAGTVVAHKTGQITRIHHDAGIVYGPRPYVLVVLVRGVEDPTASAALIADVSRMVWDVVTRPGA